MMLLSQGAAAFADGAPDYSTGTPWPDIDLEGVVTPDMPAELKDNFALYWTQRAALSSTQFPPRIGAAPKP